MAHIKSLALVVVSMISLSLGGCSAFRTPEVTPMPKEVQLTQKGGACGSGIGLDEGDTLTLILDAESSSDYAWKIGFYVPAVIEPVGEPIVQSNSASESGTSTFRFLAVGEGQAELHMIYGPPDKDSPEFKSCQVTVNVK